MQADVPTPLRVRWIGWWKSVSEPSSPFRQLLEAASGRPSVSVSPREPADVEWWSTTVGPVARGSRAAQRVLTRRGLRVPEISRYWREQARASDIPRLWWSGENVRPPGHFNRTFSFDLDEFEDTNVYLPYWWISPSLFCPEGLHPEISRMLATRTAVEPPRKFCCAFFGKIDPFRERLIRALGVVGKVDVYGRAVGRPVSDKAEVASSYAFTLCPENDLYPGYVTEKPLDAWRAQTVPLWWGSDPARYVNPRAVMNLAEFQDLAAFVAQVQAVWTDQVRWRSITSEPILLKPPDFDSVIGGIRGALSDRRSGRRQP